VNDLGAVLERQTSNRLRRAVRYELPQCLLALASDDGVDSGRRQHLLGKCGWMVAADHDVGPVPMGDLGILQGGSSAAGKGRDPDQLRSSRPHEVQEPRQRIAVGGAHGDRHVVYQIADHGAEQTQLGEVRNQVVDEHRQRRV
jgi:hypothetical protein